MTSSLSLTGRQHAELRRHLFSGDGAESVAFALCGQRVGSRRTRLLVQKLFLLPYEACDVRTPTAVSWSTDLIASLLDEADRKGLSVVKFHSHPGGFRRFSEQDDDSDAALFPSIAGWIEANVPHASVVMLPTGELFGRTVSAEGSFAPLQSISIVGEQLLIWRPELDGKSVSAPEFTKRHAAAYGERTIRLLRGLSIAIIGGSGTGSIVFEQLMRLGVGRIVVVDPDIVKDVNLNRILNTTIADVQAGASKASILASAAGRVGLGTDVTPIAKYISDPEAIRAVAECDVVFGCVDSSEGRYLANRIAAFYVLPYFDVGVALEADGAGMIDQVCGYFHYIQPDLSSIVSRGAISMEDVRAEGERRRNEQHYRDLRRAGYINNVDETRPAVISVNTVLSGLIVNEFLARLHDFRDEPGDQYATVGFSLSQMALYPEAESGVPCRLFARHVGRGDTDLLLDMPEFSEGEVR